jgi:putative aldouronate transport system substrate-binding protein
MTKLTKFAAIALAIAIAASLAACGGGGGSGGAKKEPVPDGAWNTPFKNTVNITSFTGVGNDWVFEGGDTVDNNPWTRAWKDELNIQVKWEWTTTVSTEYDTKLNMAVASKTLPDAFACNYVQYRQMKAANLLMDITDAYNKYTSPRIREYEKTDPDTIKISSDNGKIYGIPRYYYGVIDSPRDLWVRKDWYEAAGSPAIKTVADFESLAKKFMDTCGGYGIGVSNTLEWLYMTGPMFGVYLGNPCSSGNPYFWYKDASGTIKPGEAHPEFKTALEYWAKWYSEGVISKDFANMDDAKVNEDIVNGKTGMQPFWQWQGWRNGPNLVGATGNNDANMIPFNYPTVDGSQVKGQVGFPNGSIICVSSSCKNPAAVMKLISYTDYVMFDPNTVLTEEQFKGFTDGQREHAPGTFEIIDPLADMVQFEHVLHALTTGDESQLFTAGMQKKYGDSVNWLNNKDSGGLGAYLQQGFEGCAYFNSKFLLDNNFILRTDMWGPPPEAFDTTANTADILNEGVTKIIMGQNPVSSYDDLLAQWYAGGGQILEDAVNKEFK